MQKQGYLTPDNRSTKVKKWRDAIFALKRHQPFEFHPGGSALLVLDMQDFFLDPASHAFVPSAPTIIPVVRNLITNFRQSERPIIFTRHGESAGEITLMNKIWRDSLKQDDPRSALWGEFEPQNHEVLNKNRYSAFVNTDLEERLRSLGVTRLVLTGVLTHLCVETTARDAFMRGFEVFLVMDGVATYTESFHLATLSAITHGFGVCIAAEDLHF